MSENLLKGKILEQEGIKELIPHRGKWLVLNKIAEIQEKSIIAIKIFTKEECEGHFPGKLIVPGHLICEALAQAGEALVGYHRLRDPKAVLPALVATKARFLLPVLPEEEITLEVKWKSKMDLHFFEGFASVELKKVAEWAGIGAIQKLKN